MLASETAQLHHAPRRSGGGVAGRGASAASRADAADRRAPVGGGGLGRAGLARGVPATAAGIGLERGPQFADRLSLGGAERTRKYAAELVALAPDVIFASGTAQVGPLLQATRTVPIIFAIVADPVGAGVVDSLARPGDNATVFVQYEYGLSGKWLEVLKEIAPRVTRAAVLRDAAITAGVGLWGAIQTAAPSFGIE